MKITCLLENTSCRSDVLAEHGLSILIKTNSHSILFDMGQSNLFAENAKTLGIDLSEVDLAVLSHGHYDHGGGLSTFLSINKVAPVYVSQYAFGSYYNGTEKYIGLDPELQSDPRLRFINGKTALDHGFTLDSCNSLPRPNSFGSFGLTQKTSEGFRDDPFLHEQYLLIEEDGKRVLISGCSHKGILDIAEWYHPDVLIGGFHFSKLPLDRTLEQAAKRLDEKKTAYYTCHCTGEPQYAFMKRYMKNLRYLSGGQTVEL